MRFNVFKKIKRLFSKQDKRGAILMRLKEQSNKISYNINWKKLKFKEKNAKDLSKMFDS